MKWFLESFFFFRLLQIHEIIRWSESTFNCSLSTIQIVMCIGYLRFRIPHWQLATMKFETRPLVQDAKEQRSERESNISEYEEKRRRFFALFEGPLMRYFQVDYILQYNLVEISQNGYDYIRGSAKDSSRSIVLLSFSIQCRDFFLSVQLKRCTAICLTYFGAVAGKTFESILANETVRLLNWRLTTRKKI